MRAEDESRLRDLVQICVAHLTSSDSRMLQNQAQAVRGFRPTGPRIWQIDLDDSPRARLPDAPLPVEAFYLNDDCDIAGQIMIWMKCGRVDSLELPWFTDAMRMDSPGPISDLGVVTYRIPAARIVLPDLVQFFAELDSPDLVWVLTWFCCQPPRRRRTTVGEDRARSQRGLGAVPARRNVARPPPERHREGRDPARSSQRHQSGVLTCKRSSFSRPRTASGSRLSSGAKRNDRSSSPTVTMH